MIGNRVCGWLGVALVAACCAWVLPGISGEEQEKEEPSVLDGNPYLADADLKPAELVAYIKELRDLPASLRARKGVKLAVVDAATRALAGELSKEDKSFAAVAQFQALYALHSEGDEDAGKLLEELAASAKDLPDPAIAGEAKLVLLEGKLRNADFDDKPKLPPLLDEIRELLAAQGKLTERHHELASQAVRIINSLENGVDAASAYLEFAKLFSASEDPTLSKYGSQLEKFGKLLELKVKPIEIEGSLVGGAKLDWSRYKGKVVLIDFWATWCGPCVAALPSLKETYAKHHDQGFEIVGISLDQDVSELQQFLLDNSITWDNLFSTVEEEQGPKHPMVKKFGVHAIPTMVLVDQHGMFVKVVRHDKLAAEVEKLLKNPPPAPVAEKKVITPKAIP